MNEWLELWWNDWQWKTVVLNETLASEPPCPSCLTYTVMGSNRGLRGKRPSSYRLSVLRNMDVRWLCAHPGVFVTWTYRNLLACSCFFFACVFVILIDIVTACVRAKNATGRADMCPCRWCVCVCVYMDVMILSRPRCQMCRIVAVCSVITLMVCFVKVNWNVAGCRCWTNWLATNVQYCPFACRVELIRKVFYLLHWFQKCAPSSQRIRGYISVMAYVKFTYFLIKWVMFCWKSWNFVNWRYIYFVWPLEYLVRKLTDPWSERQTVSLT